jgi:hypothetical protein
MKTMMRTSMALALAGVLACGQVWAADVEGLIDEATAQVESGADARGSLDALLAALAASNDSDAIDDLLGAIEDIGDADGGSPQSVKQYLRAKAPPVLRQVFGKRIDWSTRSDALMLHRALEASDADLKEAIRLGNADQSGERDFMVSRAELLQDWLDNRSPERRAELDAAPTTAGASNQAALSEARELGVGVNVDALMDAARRGALDEVRVLLDAGIAVNAKSSAWMSPLAAASFGNCALPGADVRGNLAVMDLLIQRGADLNAFDERGNPILMPAVQQCPIEIIRKLLDAGAAVAPVNQQDFTPLDMALVLGKIDIAELLVERGARRDAAKLDRLFAETPSDPRVQAVLKRAAAKGK